MKRFILAAMAVTTTLLFLTPSVSAKDTTECVGYHQTTTTDSGLTISTCNWDLDDAPINQAAAGLDAEGPAGVVAVCPCDFFAIPQTEFNKYGIKNLVCSAFPAGDTFTTVLTARNGKGVLRINFGARVHTTQIGSGDDFCEITIVKGKLKQRLNIPFLTDEEAIQCMLDVEDYAADLGQNCVS